MVKTATHYDVNTWLKCATKTRSTSASWQILMSVPLHHFCYIINVFSVQIEHCVLAYFPVRAHFAHLHTQNVILVRNMWFGTRLQSFRRSCSSIDMEFFSPTDVRAAPHLKTGPEHSRCYITDQPQFTRRRQHCSAQRQPQGEGALSCVETGERPLALLMWSWFRSIPRPCPWVVLHVLWCSY